VPTFTLISLGEDLLLIRGRQQILDLATALQQLSSRTGQLGAMHCLEYFLDTTALLTKPPYLVLQLRHPKTADPLQPDNIVAAAVFFEYCVGGLRTGIFCTDDAVGFRSVIALREERARFAERAAAALLKKGAHVVLTTFEEFEGEQPANKPLPGILQGYRHRLVGRTLTLAPTYEETLSHLGRLTRRNLRYYRRRLASHIGLDFIPDARAELTFSEFIRLNAASINPVHCDRELWLRWRSSCRTAGGFLQGLRSAEGKWLALLGGWRHETMTVLHWQLNVEGYERDSIGIVMRSFFLEYEIALGARKLLMYGGTPHSIRFSFDEDSIADLLVCRPTLRSRILCLLAHSLPPHSRLASRNHLLQTLAVLPIPGYSRRLARLAPALQQSFVRGHRLRVRSRSELSSLTANRVP